MSTTYGPDDRPFGGPLTTAQLEAHLDGHSTGADHEHSAAAREQLTRFQRWRHEETARRVNEQGRQRRQDAQDALDEAARRLKAAIPDVTLKRKLVRGSRGYAQIVITPTREADGFLMGYEVLHRAAGAGWSKYGSTLGHDGKPRTVTLRLDPKRDHEIAVVAVAKRGRMQSVAVAVQLAGAGLDAKARAEQAEADRVAKVQEQAKRDHEARAAADAKRMADERKRAAEQQAAHEAGQPARDAEARRQEQARVDAEARMAKIRSTPPSLTIVQETRRSVQFEIAKHPSSYLVDRFQLCRVTADGTVVAAGASFPRLNKPLPVRTWRRKRGRAVQWFVLAHCKYGRVESARLTVRERG